MVLNDKIEIKWIIYWKKFSNELVFLNDEIDNFLVNVINLEVKGGML